MFLIKKKKNQRDHLISEISGSDNIFIEGENLEVLKVLQKSYYGKVKMIYIDPPYNTGNDSFIYPDKFSESKEEYLKRIGDKDEAGYLTKEGLFRKNSKESGQYHSNWLSMMYPRLFLARNLLRDDGVIFVSIDDNEVHNLRLMMNEIFGEENFVAQIVWKKKTGAGSQIDKVFSEHEYILAFVKNYSLEDRWRVETEGDGNYRNPDNDTRGPWESCAITAPSKNRNPKQFYQIEVFFDNLNQQIRDEQNKRQKIDRFVYGNHTIVFRAVPNDSDYEEYYSEEKRYARFVRRWAYIPDSMKKMFEQKRVYLKAGNLPRYKKFESEYEGKALRSIYFSEFSTQQGSEEIRALFRKDVIEFPKPSRLIKTLVNATTNDSDIILDFFAGSGTTAQAVLELNKEDGGNRRFILVQLPEKTDEESEAYKAGYKTIAGICRERIRRVCKKIKEEVEKNAGLFAEKKLDLGFKTFTLEPSNFKIWRTDTIESEEDLKRQMEAFVDPTRARSEADDPDAVGAGMAWEILLKSGYELTTPMEKLDVAGVPVYSIANGEVMVALEKITQKAIDAIIAKKSATADRPKRVVCLDKLFSGNDQLKTNTALQMKDAGIEFKTI